MHRAQRLLFLLFVLLLTPSLPLHEAVEVKQQGGGWR